MTWHNTSHYIASNDVTITWPDPATDIKTSKHFTSKHKTSPPWNGRRLVHSKEMIWASRWSVALRTFYRQILSVLYSSFPFGNFRPRLVRALLVIDACWLLLLTLLPVISLHNVRWIGGWKSSRFFQRSEMKIGLRRCVFDQLIIPKDPQIPSEGRDYTGWNLLWGWDPIRLEWAWMDS